MHFLNVAEQKHHRINIGNRFALTHSELLS